MKVLITGTAGFIGFHVARRFLQQQNTDIVGIDNISHYYDVSLKYDRLKECGINKNLILPKEIVQSNIFNNYRFQQLDLADYHSLDKLFSTEKFDYVIHIAAQAGVRYSLENPSVYVQSNMVGFANILECCRHYKIKHLVYASSSSVYGMENDIPYKENDNVDFPVSFYAATKKSNELMAHSYSHLYQLPTTGLRLFTVYGPWGRPDMAPMIFAKSIFEEKPIKLYNNGNMLRDFTYIDDIAESIFRIAHKIPTTDESHPFYRIFNVGNSCPINLLDFVQIIEKTIGKSAILNMQPMQPGDVKETYADTSALAAHIDYKPNTSPEKGISNFIAWYKEYFK